MKVLNGESLNFTFGKSEWSKLPTAEIKRESLWILQDKVLASTEKRGYMYL